MKISYLYTLNCPYSNIPKYVGITINPKQRFNNHLSQARKSTSTRKNAWIKGLLLNNLKPLMVIIAEYSLSEIEQAEKDYILKLKNEKFNLYNLTSGGEFKKEISDETKEKLRQYNLGKKQSKETVLKRTLKLTGLKRSIETRNKFSENQKGKNNSMIKSGADFSKQIEAMKNANIGKKRNPDIIKKIAEKNSIPIVQLDFNNKFIKQWDSITEVQKECGYKNGDISSVCKRAIRKGYVRKTAYGFIWKYKKDYDNKKNNS